MPAPATAIPDRTTDKPPRLRRWIPLSLRMFAVMLAILGTVCGCGALWVGVPAYRQHVAIQTLRRCGAFVITEPTAPAWLRKCLGDDRMKPFDEVTMVLWGSVIPNTTTDADMPAFEQLIHVQRIDLRRAPITDAGLMHLNGLKDLRDLDLRRTTVSDAAIAKLTRELPMLEIAGP